MLGIINQDQWYVNQNSLRIKKAKKNIFSLITMGFFGMVRNKLKAIPKLIPIWGQDEKKEDEEKSKEKGEKEKEKKEKEEKDEKEDKEDEEEDSLVDFQQIMKKEKLTLSQKLRRKRRPSEE